MKEESREEKAETTFENPVIQPENGYFGNKDVRNKIKSTHLSFEQTRVQSQKETESDIDQIDKIANKMELTEPEEIEAVKKQIIEIEDQKQSEIMEAKNRVMQIGKEAADKKTKVCGKCGAEIISSAKFCTECGNRTLPPPIPKNIEVAIVEMKPEDYEKFQKEAEVFLEKTSWKSKLTGKEKDALETKFIESYREGKATFLPFLKNVETAPVALEVLRHVLIGEFDKFEGLNPEENDLIFRDLIMSLDSIDERLQKDDPGDIKDERDPRARRRFRENALYVASEVLNTPYIHDKSVIDSWLLKHFNDLEDSSKPFKSESEWSSTLHNYSSYNILSKTENKELLKKVVRMSYNESKKDTPEDLFSDDKITTNYPAERRKEIEKLLAEWIPVEKLIVSSPSSEIQRFKTELIDELVKSENPQEDFEKIESIFLKNCLPDVGKMYKVFEVLHKRENLAQLIRENSSPVLKKESARGRQFQIYKDLLNIHLKSNNESLRDYLSVFQEGKTLFEKIDKEGLGALDQEEQGRMDYLLKRLEMLYASSWLNNNEGKLNKAETLETRLDNIKKSLALKNGQSLVERLEEMYLKPIDVETVEQALEIMNHSVQKAEQRGFAYAKEFLEKDGAKLESGDLLKGIDYRYLEKILQNGSVAGEFLGDSAISDATPLDTDVAIIKELGADSSFKEIVENSVAGNYGELMIALKNRGQFFESDNGKLQVEANKKDDLELFFTGVQGETHYGIRTGFPSTEIDFLVAKKYLSEENLKQTYLEIARNGVYVPVVDEEGKLLFTPEMYKFQRPKDYEFSKLDFKRIKNDLENEKLNPQSLLDSFKEVFSEEFIHNSGTMEGYSIEEHTLMVLSQFEKYFSGKGMPVGINERFFRLLLTLHDIGKPQAIDVGNKDFQHYYTMPILKKVFELGGFTAKEIRLGGTLIGEDPIGKYLKGEKIEDSAQYILQKSAESSMRPEELLDLFEILYKVDAGSYTKNAGGQESLDDLFEFNENNRTVDFSGETEKKMEALRKMIRH